MNFLLDTHKYLQNTSQQLRENRFQDFDVIVFGAAVHNIVEIAKRGNQNWKTKAASKLAFTTKVAESYRKQMETMIQVNDY